MPVTLSDGTTTIDIAQSEETKSRTQRLVKIPVPGAYGDKIQSLASKQLTFEYRWTMTDFTNRNTLESWQQNNTQLTLVDLEYTGGKIVFLEKWSMREIPGTPNMVEVTLTLIEKV